MENPTLVVLTDRNDLDDQLFGTFAAARTCCARRPCRRRDREHLRELLQVAVGRRDLHHHPEVLARGEGRPLPAALRPAQHRRHRRRGPPQPVRLHRRLRPPHARRPAQRLLHRLHRHAHRADRQEHPGGLRRLHQHLRHPAGGRGRRHGADLLREPAGQARAGRGREARSSTPSSRRSPRARRTERKEKLKTQVGARSRRWSAPRSGSSLVAEDLVQHFESRLEAMDGKAMIVCMSRRICVELYDAIVQAAPGLARRRRRRGRASRS